MKHTWIYFTWILVSILPLYTTNGSGLMMNKCNTLADPASWILLWSGTADNVLQCARLCDVNDTCDFVSVYENTCSMWHGEATCGANSFESFEVYKVLSRPKPLCGVGWYKYSGSCYITADTKLNWTSSQAHCISLGANLATVGSLDEEDFIAGFVTTLFPDREWFWIGGNDLSTDGVWEWVSGEPWEFEDWMDGEPYGEYQGEQEDCVSMSMTSETKRFNDMVCRYDLNYVCEKSDL